MKWPILSMLSFLVSSVEDRNPVLTEQRQSMQSNVL